MGNGRKCQKSKCAKLKEAYPREPKATIDGKAIIKDNAIRGTVFRFFFVESLQKDQ